VPVSAPLEFAATLVGGAPATHPTDGFVGYVFGLAASDNGADGRLIVQRADNPEPHEEPYCLVWGEREGTTYGGVRRVVVERGGVTFEMTTLNAAELGAPREFRISFPAEHTEVVRWGLARTLGADVVTVDVMTGTALPEPRRGAGGLGTRILRGAGAPTG
jgi:hypothetical protein